MVSNMKEKNPLYRSVNTRTHHVHHNTGSDAKHDRNTKQGLSKTMKKDKQRGLDYTPLYKFFLSKIGTSFDKAYSEAVVRLPKGDDAIDGMFYERDGEPYTRPFFMSGESTYFSTLKVDEEGLIQKVDPNYSIEHLFPRCKCCTHTFNGSVVTNKFQEPN